MEYDLLVFGRITGNDSFSGTDHEILRCGTDSRPCFAQNRRPGLLGFLGGLGMFSWLLLGAGLLGGGFLIYLLAMLLIPMIVGALAAKRKSASDDLPSSNYSSDELFKEQDKDKRQF